MVSVSRRGLMWILLFCLLAFIGRILLPFGDEPDFPVRAPHVLFGEHPIWSPYYLFSEWFNYLDVDVSARFNVIGCKIDAGALSLWATISSSCSDDLIPIIIRWISTLIILSPIFLIIIFRRGFIKFANIFTLKLSDKEWNLRIDSLGISMLFPGAIYYLGLLSVEQLHLALALYIFLFWGFWLPILGLLAILFSVDFGNSIVVLAFVLIMILFTIIRRLNRTLYFLGLLSLISFGLIFDYQLLNIITTLDFLPDKLIGMSIAIVDNYTIHQSELVTKYSIVWRPVVTLSLIHI